MFFFFSPAFLPFKQRFQASLSRSSSTSGRKSLGNGEEVIPPLPLFNPHHSLACVLSVLISQMLLRRRQAGCGVTLVPPHGQTAQAARAACVRPGNFFFSPPPPSVATSGGPCGSRSACKLQLFWCSCRNTEAVATAAKLHNKELNCLPVKRMMRLLPSCSV